MSTTTLNSEKKKALIPELRFQEFSEVSLYKKYSFNDVFQFSTGKNIKQNEASPDFETPCVRYGELYHMYNEVIYKVINKTSLEKSELLFSKGDEILLPSAGEDPLDIGSASALTIENVAIGRTINILRPIKENVYSQIYASYYINEKLRKKISKLAKGSSISNVYNSDLKTLAITLPTLPEQQKIASFLSAVDEKIQQLSRKKELLEQYKKGVMQQLFSGKLRFKDENGKDYPDWKEKKLWEVAEKRIVKNKNNKINAVFTNSAIRGIVNQRDYFDKDIANQNNLLGYYIVENNDFVYNPRISTNAPVGPISRNYLETGIMSPLYSVFRFKKGNLDFIECFFKSIIWHNHMKDISNYGARDDRMSFSTGDFYKMPIPFPCLEEQQKIANFLLGIEGKIENTGQEINKMQNFKKGLLQQMFV